MIHAVDTLSNSYPRALALIHQPHRLLQHQQVPLQQLGPVLDIPHLVQLLGSALQQLVPLGALLRRRCCLPRKLPFLLGNGCRVAMQVGCTAAHFVVERGADRREGGGHGGAGFGFVARGFGRGGGWGGHFAREMVTYWVRGMMERILCLLACSGQCWLLLGVGETNLKSNMQRSASGQLHDGATVTNVNGQVWDERTTRGQCQSTHNIMAAWGALE